MATRGALKTQICDDLDRTDMTSAASSAISSAIDYYERERWWFLQNTVDLTTSSSLAYYSLPSGVLDPDNIVITVSGQKEPLKERIFIDIDNKDSGADFGQPTEYAYYKGQVRLYDVPDKTYTLTIACQKSLATSTSDSASNAWTNTGRDLIRHRCVKELCYSKLKDINGGNVAEKQEMQEYAKLQEMNVQRMTTGQIKKSGFLGG